MKKILPNLISIPVLSVLVVVFKAQFIDGLNTIFLGYQFVSSGVSYLFESGPISLAIDFFFSVLIMLLLLYFPPTFLFKLIKKKTMPYKQHLFWFGWLTICLSIIMPSYLLGNLS